MGIRGVLSDSLVFKNFISSSNQITAKNKVGGNVGYFDLKHNSDATFQLDYVSCGNTINTSNTATSIGGI